MNRYDLAVFDLDGTLLDTKEGVLSAVKYTIEKMGLSMPDDKVLATFIGPPIQDSFARLYGLTGDILQEIATIFRNRYKEADLFKAEPYEGIYQVFEGLKNRGIASAVATYKREDYAVALLNHYHFDRYTQIIHGSDHENKLKKQDIIQICIAQAGITDYSRVVMIGDTVHDGEGAARLGLDFIGVTFGFGFHSKEDMAGTASVGCAERPLDILNYMS